MFSTTQEVVRNTHHGLYHYTHLSFAASPAIFLRTMDMINFCKVYTSWLVYKMTSSSQAKMMTNNYLHNLSFVLTQLEEYGQCFKLNKYKFMQKTVSYTG